MDTAHDPHFVTAAAVNGRRMHAAAPLLLDVRRQPAYEKTDDLIAGALRVAPEDVAAAATHLPRDRAIVTCCVHGHEVSQNAARALREAGLDATYLEGGLEGWRSAGFVTVKKQGDLGLPAAPGRPSRWITRERPKIDRIACPWLIRRFVDPLAEFLYVPAEQVLTEAQRTGAIAYDVPDVRFSHRGAEGLRCSFDALIDDLGLADAALAQVAAVVRGADTGQPDLTPQSAGLLAISLGLSINFADDHAMLDQAMPLYDALYAWAHSARAEVLNADLFRKP